jgi:putative ABC transport system ATP-binding protein
MAALGQIARRRFRHHSVHLVPQTLQLCSQLAVFENVFLVQRMQGKASPTRCRDLLSRIGLRSKLDSLPSYLSVGEKQRVCIARGLATDVPLLLLDEPTSNLDSASVSLLIDLFREAKQAGRSLLVVSTDLRLIPFADRVESLKYAVPEINTRVCVFPASSASSRDPTRPVVSMKRNLRIDS